jgi:aminobenzoyl-glutamate utilization protein B
MASQDSSTPKTRLFETVEDRREALTELAREIWAHPEVALRETESSNRLQAALEAAGFETEVGVGGIDTAFIARYGEGNPVVGTMGEFDALPGMSQRATAEPDPVEEGAPGHGCGHNLFGVGSLGGALAMKEAIDRGDAPGTVVYFGTPAEEAGGGKVYMAREDAFDGVDAVVSWHPGWYNAPGKGSCLAVDTYRVEFDGESAHAAAAPEAGRSALDAAHLMNTGVEFMREHVPDAARVHYVVTDGGDAPNVVPATAGVECLVRAPERDEVERIGDWVEDIAEAAAQMTHTETDVTLTSAMHGVVPNHALGDAIGENMHLAAPMTVDDDRAAFAADLRETLGDVSGALSELPADRRAEARETAMFTDPIEATDEGVTGSYSTDSGDVSRVVPLGRFRAATWPVGTPAHSWQAVAAGKDLGVEGALFASKVIAGTLFDVATDDDLRTAAHEEFKARTDGDPYECGLPAGADPYEMVDR